MAIQALAKKITLDFFFDAFEEKTKAIISRLDRLEQRTDRLETRLDHLMERFENMEGRINTRLDMIISVLANQQQK
ncbi:MAG: hypothetical protein HY201_04485 [Nitrospirae bacterium]|nr:hypothetical protein [Candidatus Troglogloeales bacterium]MBI3598686.1 hypothetical protein [Candidatus Troglogloeales bacterium]